MTQAWGKIEKEKMKKKSNKLVCVYHCSITISWKYCLIIECLEWKREQQYKSVRGKEKETDERHEVIAVMQQASSKSNRIERKLLLKSPNKQLIPHRRSVHTIHNINKCYFHIASFDSTVQQQYGRWKFNWMTQFKQIEMKKYKTNNIDSVYQ